MVKKEEIRIGNYILWGVNVCEVLGTIDFPILEKNNQNIYVKIANTPNRWDSEDNYEPINLDKKWLLDLGFESTILPISDCIKYHKQNIFIIIDNRFKSIHIGTQRIDDRNIKYVHQLQNLFFALTGKELEL